MKKIFTLAAAGVLAAASLSAQAQVAVDGQLTAPELTSGNYVLIGKFTMAHGFGNYGLLSLYAASTPTKVYLFVGSTVQTNGNAIQLFMKTPSSAGVPAGTELPTGTAGTYFEKVKAKMDMPVNLAVAFRVAVENATNKANSTFQLQAASYTNATTATSKVLTTTAAPIAADGTPSTIPTDAGYPALAMARVAYKSSSDATILTNPGNTTSNTDAAYGGVGSYGLEMELDRTAAGLVGAVPLTIFAIQNGDDGSYFSTDYIPQNTGPLPKGGTFNDMNNNLQGDPDFALVPGTQAATLNLSATGVTLGSKAAAAVAAGLSVYPNPVQGASTVSYQVADRATNVHIVLTDLLGRTVRTIENGLKPVGTQTAAVDASALAAGTYLVRVQVGDNVSTSKVSVL